MTPGARKFSLVGGAVIVAIGVMVFAASLRPEKAADISVPLCVSTGTVSDVVCEEALQNGVDLILIGRGALQGTLGRLRTHSYGIIRQAPCPVLSV